MLKNTIDYWVIRKSHKFDTYYYLSTYPDVLKAGIDPVKHYLQYGAVEGRNPNHDFNTMAYLKQHPELNPQKINPFVHYIRNGAEENFGQNTGTFLELASESLAGLKTSHQSCRDVQIKMLLTDQKLHYPYENDEVLAIGSMESLTISLAKKYLKQPQDVLVSIIMPTYNRGYIITSAINSVLKQKYTNWELIIIDDNSADNTEEVIKTISDPRIKYIRNNANLGAAKSRNNGLEHIKGDYICYLDSDNLLHEDFLLILTNELTNKPQFDVIYCAQRLLRFHDGVVREEGIRFSSFHRPTLENHNYIDTGVIFHRKSVIEHHHFNPKLKTCGDWDFILQITREKPAFSLPCILSEYYLEKASNQTTGSHDNTPSLVEIDSNNFLTKENLVNFPSSVIDTSLLYSPGTPIKPHNLVPVSIIIPNYNCLDYLKTCLYAVRKFSQKIDPETIIVDNGSNSEVVDFLKTIDGKDKIKVIFNRTNLGFAHAINQGIKESDLSNDIILLNNDTLVTRDWIEALQEVKANYPQVGLIVPAQVVIPGESTQIIHHPRNIENREMDVTISMRHGNIVDTQFDPVNGYIELSFAPFFCVYIPRTTILEAGDLDDELGTHYYSDYFYCDLIREYLQKKIVYTPKSKVYHFVQQATKTLATEDQVFYSHILDKKWKDNVYKE